MFDAVSFCKDHNIAYDTTGPNTSPGWVQIKCPHCRDKTNHCGINVASMHVNCWKCGHHFLDNTISELLGITKKESKELINIYIKSARYHLQKEEKLKPVTSITLPEGTGDLTKLHRDYLLSRNFSPKKIKKIFGIKGTSHLGDYAFRIIAPITYNGRLVSYQGRDVTGRSSIRYKACEKSNEIIHHKHMLYAIDHAKELSRTVVVVEGITDVWRLGPGAVCTFGTSWKQAQLLLLFKHFDNIFIIFDPEEPAQEKAHALAWGLSSLGKTVEIITGLDTDPGDMSEEEAEKLMTNFLKVRKKNGAIYQNTV